MAENDTQVRDEVRVPELHLDEGPAPANIAVREPHRDTPTPPPPPAPQMQLSQQRVIVMHSTEVALLFTALAEAQQEEGYGDVEKSKTARIKSKKEGGADYSYTYETLRDVIDATRPFLAKHGVACLQFPFPGEKSVTIRTMLTHKSGQWLYNDLSALIPMPDPQAVGSGITYLRRYAMKAILNVAAEDEDDDGAGASQQRQQPPPQAAPRRSQQKAASQQPPAAAAAPAAAQQPQQAAQAAATPNVGKVVELRDADGGLLVKLSTGYRAGTKDQLLVADIKNLVAANKDATFELTCDPPSQPGFAPKITEVALRR